MQIATLTDRHTRWVVSSAAAGYGHTAVVASSYGGYSKALAVVSWGWGHFGQLGHGSSVDELKPRMLDALSAPGAALGECAEDEVVSAMCNESTKKLKGCLKD